MGILHAVAVTHAVMLLATTVRRTFGLYSSDLPVHGIKDY
jgi:hypothetical protein